MKLKTVAIAVGFVLLGMTGQVRDTVGESPPPLEYQVKAAFLYNFAKFIEWPEEAFTDANDPIVYCVLGKDEFGSALDAMREKTIKNRKVVVLRLRDVGEAKACHIVFISSAENKRLPQLLMALEGSSVLTVGEAEPFAEMGGIVNFILVKGKVQFEINLTAAEEAGLKMSSKLLKLARVMKESRWEEY